MSGLFAIFTTDGTPLDPKLAQRVRAAAAHRDDSGRDLSPQPSAHFGDLGSGSAVAAGGRWDVVVHGRLDNREDLRRALGVRGESSDAELVAAALDRWRDDTPGRLIGPISFVGLDRHTRRVHAMRGFTGAKPLLWRRTGNVIAFASECAPLVVGLGPRPGVNESMVAEYVAGAPRHRSETVWAGIDRVVQGTSVVGPIGSPAIERWWVYAPPEPTDRSPQSWIDELQETFTSSVRSCVDQTRGSGVELSGGLDSTTVLGVACSVTPTDRLCAAVLDYPGMATDESSYWQAALDEYGVDAIITDGRTDPGRWMLDDARQIADRVALPHLGVRRAEYQQLRARGMVSSLTGHGGDERLGHSYALPQYLLAKGRLGDARQASTAHVGASEDAVYRSLLGSLRQAITTAVPAVRRIKRSPLRPRAWLVDEFVDRAGLVERLDDRVSLRERVAPFVADGARLDAVRTELVHWAFGEVPNQYLEATERFSAAFGIELRHPFIDQRMIELCLRMPESVRTSPTDPRAAHRAAFGHVLPGRVRNRSSKASFSEPYLHHLQGQGVFADPSTSALVANGWIDRDWLSGAVAGAGRGDQAWAQLLVTLATIEAWAVTWT